MSDPTERLSPRQRQLLERWLPGYAVTGDLGWDLMGRVVAAIEHEGSSYVLKAGEQWDHHEGREIQAYLTWARSWSQAGCAPQLLHHDAEQRMLVVERLPGRLVLGSDHARKPEVYRQAGRLLRQLHAEEQGSDDGFEARENERALAWLDRPHRIPRVTVERIRRDIGSWPTPPAITVPTHGDYHPRNWLIDDAGVVRVIDLGRAALRPAATDLLRLDSREFQDRPELERAFLEGYDGDPREPDSWRRMQLREGVSTAAWAHHVGDAEFEEHGLAMIERALVDS